MGVYTAREMNTALVYVVGEQRTTYQLIVLVTKEHKDMLFEQIHLINMCLSIFERGDSFLVLAHSELY
jgi:hypothetical protein